jgi:hypothetical protein
VAQNQRRRISAGHYKPWDTRQTLAKKQMEAAMPPLPRIRRSDGGAGNGLLGRRLNNAAIVAAAAGSRDGDDCDKAADTNEDPTGGAQLRLLDASGFAGGKRTSIRGKGR